MGSVLTSKTSNNIKGPIKRPETNPTKAAGKAPKNTAVKSTGIYIVCAKAEGIPPVKIINPVFKKRKPKITNHKIRMIFVL